VFSLSTLIVAVIAGLIVGGLAGTFIARAMSPQEKQNRELASKLAEAEEKLLNYQQDVNDHFAQTSQLINNMTHSYKEVHEHLASSALNLTNIDLSRQLSAAGQGTLSHTPSPTDANDDDEKQPIEAEDFEAPKDWAPKEPGETGTLSEEYRIEDDLDIAAKTAIPAKEAKEA